MKRSVLAIILVFVSVLGNIGSAPRLLASAPTNAKPAATNQTVFLPMAIRSAPPPTSDQLIDQAQASGAISAETALIDHVFAVFGDPRLPIQYRGDNSGSFGDDVMTHVAAKYASLSPAAQATLQPFRIPPTYVGSWAAPTTPSAAAGGAQSSGNNGMAPNADIPAVGNQPTVCKAEAAGWTAYDTPNGKIRVWFQAGYRAQAETVALAANDAWQKLTAYMGREPLSDANSSCNQGDGRLDMYLSDISELGLTLNHGLGCEDDDTYILINRAASAQILRAAAIHELMHAIQWSYNVAAFCLDAYGPFQDMTANWAIEYVDHANDKEHEHIPVFMSTLDQPLEMVDAAKLRPYGAYLFPWFLTKTAGGDMVRKIWEATTTQDTPLAAVNTALGSAGGFADQWPKFALHNWNRDAVWSVDPNDYKAWDGITDSPNPTLDQNVALGNLPDALYVLPTSIPHLAAKYYHFTFSDANARTVTFYNGLGFNLHLGSYDDGNGAGNETLLWKSVTDEQKKGLKIQALLKIDNQWKPIQDWTNTPYQDFCRDRHAERIQELLIVISNSEWQDTNYKLEPQGLEPTVRVSDVGCWRWQGGAQESGADNGFSNTTAATGVVVERDPVTVQQSGDDSYIPPASFHVIAGTVTRDHTVYATPQCTWHYGGSAPLTQNDNGSSLSIRTYDTSGSRYYRTYDAYGYNSTRIQGSGSCDPGSEDIGEWWGTGSPSPRLDSTGMRLNGPYIYGLFTDQWQFTAIAEP